MLTHDHGNQSHEADAVPLRQVPGQPDLVSAWPASRHGLVVRLNRVGLRRADAGALISKPWVKLKATSRLLFQQFPRRI